MGSGEQGSASSSDQQGHTDLGMTAGSSMTGDRTMAPPTKCKPCGEATQHQEQTNTEHDYVVMHSSHESVAMIPGGISEGKARAGGGSNKISPYRKLLLHLRRKCD